MAPNAFARRERTNRIRKRTHVRGFEFELGARVVLVRNGSYADPSERGYQATIVDGVPIACECPADERYEAACKHRVAVAIRKPLLEATIRR